MKFKFRLLLAGMLISFFSCTITELEEKIAYVEDLTYSIESVSALTPIDLNANSYCSRKLFTMVVKLEEDFTRVIQPAVFYKNVDSTEYKFYTYIDNTSVDGNNVANTIPFELSSMEKGLTRGTYDFKIDIVQRGLERIEATVSADDTTTSATIATALSDHKMEEHYTDISYSLTVEWYGEYDRTENDYPRYAKLRLDANIDDTVNAPIKAKIYKKLSSESTFELYQTSEKFTINSDVDTDTISVDIGTSYDSTLVTGIYDFKIELFDGDHDFLIESFTDLDDLKEKNFESLKDDTYFYTISSISWSDQIDMNGNGWDQSRNINIDVDVDKDEERDMVAEFFIRPPDSVNYAKYGEDIEFSIDGNSSDDALQIEVKLDTLITRRSQALCDFMLNVFEQDVEDTARVIEAGANFLNFESELYQQKFETITNDTTGIR